MDDRELYSHILEINKKLDRILGILESEITEEEEQEEEQSEKETPKRTINMREK